MQTHAGMDTNLSDALESPALRPSTAVLLAQGRELVSRAQYRQAYALFMRASQQAHEAGEFAVEAKSQALLSYAAAALGHNEEAVETAMLASQLANNANDERTRLMVMTYLGVALLWNGSHEGAEAVLSQGFNMARHHGELSECFWHPQINRCFNEAYRLFWLRHLERRVPQITRLGALLAQLDEHAIMRSELAPPAPLSKALLLWLRALMQIWSPTPTGSTSHALAALRAFRVQADRQHGLPLVQALLHWLDCEFALAAGQTGPALRAAQQMRALCERMEQHPMLCVAMLLSAEAQERQGQTDEALASLRRLQWREHRLRQVSMQHRRDVAALRFELRQRKLEVQSLRSNAQQLQRLSMEDALTGLANRRGLELQLDAALLSKHPPEDMALYLSVVDVDRFKAVNDRYSHRVGDQVLKALAALFVQLLRAQDIAGRWGGDEFVLAFWAKDDAHATVVTERLRQAVLSHPWDSLAEGLRVSISLGLTRAHAEDCLDSLLLRSDLSMYTDKRAQPAATVSDAGGLSAAAPDRAD